MKKKPLFGLFLIGLAGVYLLWAQVYLPQTDRTDPITVEIEIGGISTVAGLATYLDEQEIIGSAALMTRYVQLFGNDRGLQIGTYTFRAPFTIASIARTLEGPASQEEREITILPGWSLREIAEYFDQEGIATKEDVYQLLGAPATEYAVGLPYETHARIAQDKPETISFDGYLAPETYRVFAGASLEEIVDRLIAQRESEFSEADYAAIAAAGRTPFEVLTIASLLEREVRGETNKKLVADLFWRRYDDGWKLQADSTVHFIVGTDGSVFTSAADRAIDSPWNTYRYTGLPAGPIGTPSRLAIEAAIYPTPNEYWYFLTTLDTGEVKFGRTLAEHNANIQQYLR